MLTRLCRNPKPGSNFSPAAIYYAIEEYSPLTLFIDEMDISRTAAKPAGIS